jgi:hypothetical protein
LAAASFDRTLGDRAFAVDLAAVVAVSVAICLAGHRLTLMTVLVPVILLARLVWWLRLPDDERDATRAGELCFYLLCTAVGAFNDWSSVTWHRVYDYTVPTDLPGLSDIPTWMLLYWGMILRFVLSLARWRRLRLPPREDVVHLGPLKLRGAAPTIGFQLALVLATRQAVYRLYDHPLWSWLPFALALVIALWVLRPDRRRLALLAGVVVVGPLVEVLYIQVGGLHAYRLGWLAGVPLWIALWWGLAVLVWTDLGARLLSRASAMTSATKP